MICMSLLLSSNLFPQIRFRPEQHFGIRVGWVEVRERAPSHSQISLSPLPGCCSAGARFYFIRIYSTFAQLGREGGKRRHTTKLEVWRFHCMSEASRSYSAATLVVWFVVRAADLPKQKQETVLKHGLYNLQACGTSSGCYERKGMNQFRFTA